MNNDTVPNNIQEDFVQKSILYHRTNNLGMAIADWAYLNLHSFASMVVEGCYDLQEEGGYNLGGDFIKYATEQLYSLKERYKHNLERSPFVLDNDFSGRLEKGNANIGFEDEQQKEKFNSFYRFLNGMGNCSVKEFKEMCEKELSSCFWRGMFNLNNKDAENAPKIDRLIECKSLAEIKNCLDEVAERFANERVSVVRRHVVLNLLGCERAEMLDLVEGLSPKINRQIKVVQIKDCLRHGKFLSAIKMGTKESER